MENLQTWISENAVDWAIQIGIAIAIFIVGKFIARKLSMVIADGTVAVDGRVIYTADDLKVGLFQSTENF